MPLVVALKSTVWKRLSDHHANGEVRLFGQEETSHWHRHLIATRMLSYTRDEDHKIPSTDIYTHKAYSTYKTAVESGYLNVYRHVWSIYNIV